MKIKSLVVYIIASLISWFVTGCFGAILIDRAFITKETAITGLLGETIISIALSIKTLKKLKTLCLGEDNGNMTAVPIKKSGLTPEKKIGLKKIMGKFSGKASLSLIREARKDETETNKEPADKLISAAEATKRTNRNIDTIKGVLEDIRNNINVAIKYNHAGTYVETNLSDADLYTLKRILIDKGYEASTCDRNHDGKVGIVIKWEYNSK